MRTYLFLLLLCFTGYGIAQEIDPEEINGSYIAKFEEKGALRPTPERKITLALKDDQPILSVIMCIECFPATFTYDEKLSEGFGKAVFKNSLGIYMIVYNEKGFAVVIPDTNNPETFSFVNLYTRSKRDYETVTKAQISKYAESLLDMI